MKQLIFCLSLFIMKGASAQTTFYDSVNQRLDKVSKDGLLILSAWSLASITSGVIGQNYTMGAKHYFHKTNIIWGGINLGISQLSYWGIRKKGTKGYTAVQTFRRTESTEKIFLFNAGLDLAYITYGLYSRERAQRFSGRKRDQLRGTGNAFIVQGSFLALFDCVLYLLHNKNGNRLYERLQHLSLAATQNGLGVVYVF
jgi:hypothetical protein